VLPCLPAGAPRNLWRNGLGGLIPERIREAREAPQPLQLALFLRGPLRDLSAIMELHGLISFRRRLLSPFDQIEHAADRVREHCTRLPRTFMPSTMA
jgi:hypothetical protein